MNLRIEQRIPIVSIHSELARNPDGCLRTANFIDLHLAYDEGSRNWFSGSVNARGYYLHASPVELNEGTGVICTLMGSGVKDLLLEVTRRSDKQQEIAATIAESKASALLEWCRREYGIICEVPAVIFPDAKKRPVPVNLKKPEPARKIDPASIRPIRTMKLLTAEIIRKLEKHPFGSQDGKGENAEVLVKFFGGGAYTFLVTEGEKQEDGDWMLFGKATHGFGWEWGYTMLSEIENMKFPPFGLGAERDRYLASGAKVCEVAV